MRSGTVASRRVAATACGMRSTLRDALTVRGGRRPLWLKPGRQQLSESDSNGRKHHLRLCFAASSRSLFSGFFSVSPAASGFSAGSSTACKYPSGSFSGGPSQRGHWSLVPGLPPSFGLFDVIWTSTTLLDVAVRIWSWVFSAIPYRLIGRSIPLRVLVAGRLLLAGHHLRLLANVPGYSSNNIPLIRWFPRGRADLP
jgi:hypothetical protein